MKFNHFETNAIRSQAERSQFKEHSSSLYLTSSFIFDNTNEMTAAFNDEIQREIYSRLSNPNTSEFVSKVVAMEGAEDGYAFASGMSAIFSTFGALLSSGDHIISCQSIFGSTHVLFNTYLPKWGINTSYFDVANPSEIESLIQPSTKIIYAETPTNPGVDILDLSYLGKIAKKHGILLVIDNCFATPYIQQPIKFGADIVVHSATKLMDGQGRVLGGIVVGSKEIIAEIHAFSRHTGPTMSPFNAWVLSKSLETLAIRVEKHSENALQLATFLENHENVQKVLYPFLPSHPQYKIAKQQMKLGGNIISAEIKGGLEGGKKVLNSLQMCSLSANLGDVKTIVTHPASTTHSKLSETEQLNAGITPGLIRISVGLEHISDIISDFEQALKE